MSAFNFRQALEAACSIVLGLALILAVRAEMPERKQKCGES